MTIISVCTIVYESQHVILVNQNAIKYIDLASLELDISIESMIRTNAVDSLLADCTIKKLSVLL